MKISEVVKKLEEWAPSSAAERWDNVGLLVGDASAETKAAVVSVDLNEEALAAARARGARLIVNHHPCIFPRDHGLSRLTAGDRKSGLVFRAIQEGIAVYASHTNFDRCAMEVVEQIAAAMGARPVGRLHDRGAGSCVKLVTFVPLANLEAVRAAICAAGAGQIGDYDFCTFTASGEGTFRGLSGTNPAVGQAGKLERVAEVRLETLVPRGLEGAVLAALRGAHPYEEVAFDWVPVEQPPASKGVVRGLGYGFYGDFDQPISFSEFSSRVARAFETKGMIVTPAGLGGADSSSKMLKRMAWSPGKGSSFVSAARAAGCDVYVMGEVGYHSALEGAAAGMGVLEIGHRESERFYLKVMTEKLKSLGLDAQELNTPTQRCLLL
ncbi:MAG: Nif3-like dinuclear metal center hexameric protein [Bdellovibrionales bacterium]|nr:Nif3-like dinuclear metal center hexameric protein [Bdellovibrionales bacterium]